MMERQRERDRSNGDDRVMDRPRERRKEAVQLWTMGQERERERPVLRTEESGASLQQREEIQGRRFRLYFLRI
jgi:hypothetical protein